MAVPEIVEQPDRQVPDHRVLGRELDLFDTDPLIGAGLPFWLPAGAAVRRALEDYARELERLAGYQHVYSPVLAKTRLYELSGHLEHYREDMFPPMPMGAEHLVLRPSLCPHHALVYRSRPRSHRDLPLRIAELGGMFREEASGVLGGLTRVRGIQLNDAHVFCTPAQVSAEIEGALGLIEEAYRDLGITAHRYRLSLPELLPGPGSKYVADGDLWRLGEQALREVLDASGIPYDAERGEAAFYGPKIDVQIVDPAGRESTLSTVQVDLHMPRRFDLGYVDADGTRQRPVMIHRAVLGSLERLVAHLVEHYAGAFPTWLAPVQAVLLPVTDDQADAAAGLADRYRRAGLRVDVAPADRGTLAARIRDRRLVPYQLVIGPREVAEGSVSVRLRTGDRWGALDADDALHRIADVVDRRSHAL
jgi:threonyl-tRNA synthetase